MRTRSSLLIVALATFAVLSAVPTLAKTVKGSGDPSREVHEFEGLSGVVNTTQGDLELKLGTEERLEVEMDDNLHQYLRLNVDDGILKIRFERGMRIKTRKPIRMTLTVGELTYVGVTGSGNLSADNLKCGDLRVKVTGSGDVHFDALEVRELDAKLTGSGDLRLDELRADEVGFALTGSGDVESRDVRARGFDASLSGSGDMRVSGEVTEQDLRLTGSGDYRGADLASKNANVSVTGSGDARVHVSSELTVRLTGSGDVSVRGRPAITKRVTGSGELRRI